jgi:membrane-associated protein
MERRRFFFWSAFGAVLWVLSITLLGFFLGRRFPALGQNIDYAVVAILLFSVIPVAYEWWKHRRKGRASGGAPQAGSAVEAEKAADQA